MRAIDRMWGQMGGVLLALAVPITAFAQPATGGPAPPATHVSLDDAVRLAVVHNHALRAQRLNTDLAKADEVTAALKPNPVFTSTNENFPVFAPTDLFSWNNLTTNQNFVESFSYLFERGNKRRIRTTVARDTTGLTINATADAERQLAFQTAQAFIGVLLAQSTLDLAKENLANFTDVLEVNRARLRAGDLAEADFLKISLQKLQFEQDLASAQVGLSLAKTTLRQNVGFDGLAADFQVDGTLQRTPTSTTLDALLRAALGARPDLLAAHNGVQLAADTEALAYSNRVRDLTAGVEYDRAGSLNAVGFTVSIDLQVHDRNQGNIAHAKVGKLQASEVEAAVQTTVRAEVESAWVTLQSSAQVVQLFESGYLDQAKESLAIARYVYQQGNGPLLDLLDAERTSRSTELAYRQALASYMTSVQQVNFAVGKQVLP